MTSFTGIIFTHFSHFFQLIWKARKVGNYSALFPTICNYFRPFDSLFLIFKQKWCGETNLTCDLGPKTKNFACGALCQHIKISFWRVFHETVSIPRFKMMFYERVPIKLLQKWIKRLLKSSKHRTKQTKQNFILREGLRNNLWTIMVHIFKKLTKWNGSFVWKRFPQYQSNHIGFCYKLFV